MFIVASKHRVGSVVKAMAVVAVQVCLTPFLTKPVYQSKPLELTMGSVVKATAVWLPSSVHPFLTKPINQSKPLELTIGSVVKTMAVVAAQLWPGARLTGEVASAFSTHTNSLQSRGVHLSVSVKRLTKGGAQRSCTQTAAAMPQQLMGVRVSQLQMGRPDRVGMQPLP